MIVINFICNMCMCNAIMDATLLSNRPLILMTSPVVVLKFDNLMILVNYPWVLTGSFCRFLLSSTRS